MRWPWQKRRDRPEPVLAAPGAGREASAPAPAAAPRPGPRREWATLPPLQPLAPRRPVTTVDVELAKVSAVPTTLVHRFEPRAHAGEAPTGVWLDAAHLAGDVEARQPEPARAASATDAAMELPPLVMRWAPAVEPDPVIEPPVAEPAASSAAPAAADQPVPVPPPLTREPSGSTATTEPNGSQPDDADEIVESLPPRPLKRNLGQTRRLGLGPPIMRELEPEPEPEATEPVPDDIRRELHSAYGVDVGDVTIRRDDAAASEARDLGAIAFARDGREVVLPADVGSIDRPDVKGVVAHELTHIAQQRRGGPSLPDETSTEGMALEAEARAAEQRFRGDAGAPPLTRPGTGGHAQLLTTGLAETNDAGDVVFVPPPRAAAGVQRLVLEATTPPYQWQRDYVGPEGAATPLEPPPPEGGEGEFPPSIDDATFERENLPELVQYRQTQRQQYVEDELVSTGFTGPPPPAPAAAPLTEDQQRALDERTAIEAELQRRTQVVDVHNRAVDEVNVALPLQDTAADPGAEPSPADIEPEVVRLRGELARIDASYPDLVHPALEIGERGPAFRPRDLIREVIPGVRSMPVIGPALAGVPGGLTTGTTGLTATGLAGTGLTPGIGIAPGTLTPSTPTGRSLIGEVGTTSVRDSSSYSIDRGEESDFTDWLDEGDTDLATLVEEDAREREYQRWPEIRTARNQLLRYFIAEKATEIRTEAQAAGTDVPSEYQATSRITRDEWQAIAAAVEQMVPLEYPENEQYTLFDDPENDHLREAVALAPTSREAPSSLEAPRGAVAPAGVSGAPMSFTPTAGAMLTAERPVFAGTAADVGSAATPQQFALATGPVALDETEVAAETGEAAGGAAAATGGAESELRLDDPEIEISTELLIRLTTELYPRLRSRLRTELLVDRERAGLLTDFR